MVEFVDNYAPTSYSPIRLLVVDDHAVVRRGIAAIAAGTHIGVVGEASTAAEAIVLAAKLQPDVVLLDVRMPDKEGLQALPAIRESAPRAKAIVFTAYEDPRFIVRAGAAGARGYLLKGATRDEICTAITYAHAQFPLEAGSLVNGLSRAAFRRLDTQSENSPLSKRELEVLRNLARGLSNREIGQALRIAPDAVKVNVQNILRKLAVEDRTQAAVWAAKNGFL